MKTPLMLLTLALGLSACTPSPVQAPVPADVVVLGLNDFHGNLVPTGFAGIKMPAPTATNPSATANLAAGGAEIIGGYVASARAANANTILVGGGDLIGASPVISSLLRDEPSVIALSKMGMAVSSLGNHEFDQGLKELMRMQNGGCDSNDTAKACKFDPAYPGASFKWLGANVTDKTSGKPVFAPYQIVTTPSGARIAFVGAVTKTTPTIVAPSGVATLNFGDEADGVNKYIPEIKALNPDAIIMLIHEGGNATDTYNVAGCNSLMGNIIDIAKRVDPAVNAIISGHTHQGYNCLVPDPAGKGRVVIQGDFYGHLLQRLDLQVDMANHKLLSIKAANVVMDASSATTISKDATQTGIVAKAKSLTDAVKNTVVGQITVPQILRATNAAGESALGDVIADSQLAATSSAATGNAVIALMNPGGIRADLPDSTNIKPDNSVNFGDAFTVQPFGNTLTTITLTGAQLKAVLEQQFENPDATSNRILQVSAGLTYTWTAAAPKGSKVSDLALKGAPIVAGSSYRVTVNNFLADGGDGFTVLKDGTDRLVQPNLVDVDAFQAYLKASGPVAPGAQNRITKK
ncbi:bifunctional metallophosphatase/5'-nucleotidase [Deinococcus altitudinis]|uniref:bifunctional metallophosphatase/5'-nucleotidase n=1 Tax=Deinococcus altitudinis TaxID=468914 RepID=UPI003891C7F7